MKNLLWIQALLILLTSCSDNFLDEDLANTEVGDVCQINTEILPPTGFEIDTLGEINFNGSVQGFQFVDHKVGYAMVGNNVGGFVEVFKTENGGETWSDLEIGIDQHPRSMVFKDADTGIITVHDVTGCPNSCQDKTVLLKTENGGADWEEIEIQGINGILYHPTFDKNGNLYASLSMIDKPTAIMKSTDNGTTWDTLYTAPELKFELVTFSFGIIENQLYIPTKDGNLIVINTEGEWQKTLAIGSTTIWDLELIDTDNMVVALGNEVIKSSNGGTTWETIYNGSARLIGFDSVDKGLMLQKKSACPIDVYQVNDLIASTNNGGLNWNEATQTTTNLRANFAQSQQMGENVWYAMVDNYLISIHETQLK